jgi:hypothetical protein
MMWCSCVLALIQVHSWVSSSGEFLICSLPNRKRIT